ncbi:MAG: hypothetical protein LBI39_01645 [Puniceicoccales bacterium]|jgi:hypothetical protein|nr:hypothetical protein [Puniceicoccales bacterium]
MMTQMRNSSLPVAARLFGHGEEFIGKVATSTGVYSGSEAYCKAMDVASPMLFVSKEELLIYVILSAVTLSLYHWIQLYLSFHHKELVTGSFPTGYGEKGTIGKLLSSRALRIPENRPYLDLLRLIAPIFEQADRGELADFSAGRSDFGIESFDLADKDFQSEALRRLEYALRAAGLSGAAYPKPVQIPEKAAIGGIAAIHSPAEMLCLLIILYAQQVVSAGADWPEMADGNCGACEALERINATIAEAGTLIDVAFQPLVRANPSGLDEANFRRLVEKVDVAGAGLVEYFRWHSNPSKHSPDARKAEERFKRALAEIGLWEKS